MSLKEFLERTPAHGAGGSYNLTGTDGIDDVLQGGGGSRVYGHGGNDILTGGGNDTLYGGAGDDWLTGGGKDTLYGGDGDDTLIAQGGGNRLTGGAGHDVFRLETSLDQLADGSVQPDVITDFTPGEDRIELNKSLFARLCTGPLSGFDSDLVQYKATTGALLYNLDGGASGATIHFATLSNKPKDVDPGDLFAVA